MKLSIPEEEIMGHGHLACQGCGAALAMRYALKAFGRNTVMTFPACCWSVIDGPFPHSAVNVPLFHTCFEAAASTASGIKAGFDAQGKDVNVVAWAGDGGTYDIGIQALSGAAERNDDIIYVCYDNEAYMNTGVQRSGSTPYLSWTTTTPVKHPKQRPKKDIVSIMAAHRIPYLATASVAFPEDMITKFKKAKDIKGTRFLLVFSPCPPGWRANPENTIKLAKLAVLTRVFPLIEVENGRVWKLTKKVRTVKPVSEYLKLQGRFRHLSEDDVAVIQENTNKDWEILMDKVGEKD
ncbi:MAG: 3-methyl-2-oxobutanoate dehydrogenase subunit beta [Candidatus Stahlbacteria bacterium]|nr:MAG: 3-methyl-2-oxobutanoate dehydrogenase subunit beta [Candidatus Stahlbacteria bacterium]